jgi:hypothetical protein
MCGDYLRSVYFAYVLFRFWPVGAEKDVPADRDAMPALEIGSANGDRVVYGAASVIRSNKREIRARVAI